MSKMGITPKKYSKEYKIQAVHLASEIGIANAARKLGISKNTLSPWVKAVREGSLGTGTISTTQDLETSNAAVDVLSDARTYILDLEHENKRLKEIITFLRNA